MLTNTFLEEEYILNTPLEHRQKYAQFFTPFEIAEIMSQWILGHKYLKCVLDPSFGLGIFARTLYKYRDDISITGYEVDKFILSKSEIYFNNLKNLNIHNKDYIFNDWDSKYDAIIGNPPYFKFHDYDNKNNIKKISKKISMELSGFTNLYSLFLLKSIYQLNDQGRLAYIVPSEFLNSDYGVKIKDYLVKSKTLRYIIVVDFTENVFNDTLTTACILLCAKDDNYEKVGFLNISSLEDLDEIKSIVNCYPNADAENTVTYFNLKQLEPAKKWRRFYQKQNATYYKNLVPFSKFAKASRGIATGANDFFVFNQSKAEQHCIGEEYLLPCVCKSKDITNPFFTDNLFNNLKENNKDVFLLNAKEPLNYDVIKYLDYGIQQGINEKHLTSKRNPWYSIEKRSPAPIWFSVFNRTGIKIIFNEANTSHLTTFHGIYPLYTCDIALLSAYFLTNMSKQILEDNQREYGNGLKKFEPNDINNGLVIDFDLIDYKTQKSIIYLFHNYRQSVIADKPDKYIINEIEDIFSGIFSL